MMGKPPRRGRGSGGQALGGMPGLKALRGVGLDELQPGVSKAKL